MAVAATEPGTRQVEQGVQSTSRAGDSLKQLIHMSEQVGEMITHIATAATDQSSATEQSQQHQSDCHHHPRVRRWRARVRESLRELTELAHNLQNTVFKFKLDEATSEPIAMRRKSLTSLAQSEGQAQDWQELTPPGDRKKS